MDEAVKNFVVLVWTFSAININIENSDVHTLLLSEEKTDIPVQVMVDLDAKESQTERNKLKNLLKKSENKT